MSCANAPTAGSGATLCQTHPVRGLDVVDLGHGVSVDRDLELSVREAANRMDRHFEVGMLAVLHDQEVVWVDLTDMSKQRAVEGSNWGSHRNVAGTVRIVRHLVSFGPERSPLVWCALSVVTLESEGQHVRTAA